MSHWPLGPLMALARTRDGDRMSMKDLSLQLGMSPSTVQGWLKSGIPSDEKAEHAAIHLGFNPEVVWDGWLDAQIAAASIRCVECSESFVPSRRGVKFCSKQCRWRFNKRRNYDPARKKEQNDRYRQECGDYIRRYAVRYRQVNAERLAVYRRERYQRDKEKELARNRAYYYANREQEIAYQREYRAKKKAERQALAQAADNTVDSGVAPGLSASDGTVAA